MKGGQYAVLGSRIFHDRGGGGMVRLWGIAAAATDVAKILFFIFLIVFVITLALGLIRRA